MPVDRYVVRFHSGIGPSDPYPQAPTAENTARSLSDAEALFRQVAETAGRAGVTANDGGPWADVGLSEAWDGIVYSEAGYLYRFTFGPRGGVVRETW